MTVGLDVSDRYTQVCVMDPAGAIVEEGRVRTRPEAIADRFAGRARMRIALEAGTHSPWMSRLLESRGHEVYVADSRRLPLISSSVSKDDRRDAEMLARLVRSDPALLSPIRHRPEQVQADRMTLQSRDALVQARTSLINRVRGLVKPFGIRLPRTATRSFATRVRDHIPEEAREAVAPLLRMIEELSEEIRKADRLVEEIAQKRYPVTEHLRAVNGVGALTALAFVVTVVDPRRFRNSRIVGSYLGLRPRRNASGDSDPQLRITKAGDPWMRRLLVQSAQYILGPFGKDCALRRFGLARAARGGKLAKRKAVVAVARKLSVLLHRLWVTGEVYDPLRGALPLTEAK
jgi:transposase